MRSQSRCGRARPHGRQLLSCESATPGHTPSVTVAPCLPAPGHVRAEAIRVRHWRDGGFARSALLEATRPILLRDPRCIHISRLDPARGARGMNGPLPHGCSSPPAYTTARILPHRAAYHPATHRRSHFSCLYFNPPHLRPHLFCRRQLAPPYAHFPSASAFDAVRRASGGCVL